MSDYKFNYDDYNYFKDSNLPKLILGIKINSTHPHQEDYKFRQDKEWGKIAHQTSGHACHTHYFIGTILTPKSELINKIKDICDEYLDSGIGCFGVNIHELNSYVDLLKNKLDVHCDWSYKDFEEGLYPIDYTKENLAKLSNDIFPDDVDDLIEWENPFKKSIGCIHRWGIWVLGQNCD